MDKLKFAEGLGKKIVTDQHHLFNAEGGEDLEYIKNIKHIITSFSAYLESEGVPQVHINGLTDQLKNLARPGYIEMCISNKYDDEDDDMVKEESGVWFDYIYKNERYPE